MFLLKYYQNYGKTGDGSMSLLTAVGFNNPKQFPSIEQAFPNLFECEEQQDWRIMKQRVEAFAKAKSNKDKLTTD